MKTFKLTLPALRRNSKEKAAADELMTPPESPKRHRVSWSSAGSGLTEGPSSSHDPFWPAGGCYFSSTPNTTSSAPFSTTQEGLQVIVVGAGFAGLSAAIACSRQGFSVTLLERSGGPSKHGDCITIGSNAAKLLRRWGNGELTDEMWRISAKGRWWLIKDQNGMVLRADDISEFPALYGSPILQGSRSKFAGLLGVEARLNGVNVRLSSLAVRYVDSSRTPAVVVRGADGEEETLSADVIIVADGVNSVGRQLIDDQLQAAAISPSPHGAAGPRSKYSIHRGLMRSDAIRADDSISYLLDGCTRTWIGDDCHLFMMSVSGGKELSFVFVHSDSAAAATLDWRDARPISEVVELLLGWDPDLVAAIKLFPKALHWRKVEESAAERWTSNNGRIVLLGDSVHPLPPSSFQGGSQAIESAAALAVCLALGGSDGVTKATRAFERHRRPRVAETLAAGVTQRQLWHTYKASGGLPSHLDLLIARAYDFDAELAAVASFEREVQQEDPTFSLPQERKHAVLARLEVCKEGPMLFYPEPRRKSPPK